MFFTLFDNLTPETPPRVIAEGRAGLMGYQPCLFFERNKKHEISDS